MAKGTAQRYAIYDGDVLIGLYTGAQAGERFGVHKYSISKYAYSGARLRGRYTVRREADIVEKEIRKWDCRKGWAEEWEAVTAALRKELRTEKMLRAEWEAAVKPFQRRSWLWKEAGG